MAELTFGVSSEDTIGASRPVIVQQVLSIPITTEQNLKG